jgi:MFS transporter, DHA2 family, multidrug resistance protein
VNFAAKTGKSLSGEALISTSSPSYPWKVLSVVSIGTFMASLDSTIVNVCLAKFMVVFGVSSNTVQWVITAYMIAFAIMLAASGWIADRFGAKAVSIFALAVFTVGSGLCSVAWNITALIVFRVVQGLGGGLIQPVALAIVGREVPREKLGIAMGLFGIATFASTSVGPTLGGWLVDNYAWSVVFDINIPFGIIGILAGAAVLRDQRARSPSAFDLPGFVSIVVFLVGFIVALTSGNASWNADGWGAPFVIGCFSASAAGLVAFIAVELSVSHPLIDLSLFKYRNFTIASVLFFSFGLGLFGADFLLPLYMQNVLGYSSQLAGLVFIPDGIALAVAAVASGRITDRVGARAPAIAGIALLGYCFLRYTALTLDTGIFFIIATITLLGTGLGAVSSPLQTTAMSQLPSTKFAQAAGLISVIKQIGGSFGVALLSTLLTNRTIYHEAMLSQSQTKRSQVLISTMSGLASTAFHRGAGTISAAKRESESLFTMIAKKHAATSAISDVFAFAMVVILSTAIPIFFIGKNAGPRKRDGDRLPTDGGCNRE